jgi:hypothetical protein
LTIPDFINFKGSLSGFNFPLFFIDQSEPG